MQALEVVQVQVLEVVSVLVWLLFREQVQVSAQISELVSVPEHTPQEQVRLLRVNFLE